MNLSSSDSLILNSYLMLHRSALLLLPREAAEWGLFPDLQWRDINILVLPGDWAEGSEEQLEDFLDRILNDRFSAWVSWIVVGEGEFLGELELYFNFLLGEIASSQEALVESLSLAYLPEETCWQNWAILKTRFNAVFKLVSGNPLESTDQTDQDVVTPTGVQDDLQSLPSLRWQRGKTIVEALQTDRLEAANLWKTKAVQAFQDQCWPLAIQAYQKAIFYNPFIPSFWADLGSALFKLQRYPEAKAALQKAIVMNLSNGESYYSLGLVEEALENWGNAIHAYQHSLDLNPQAIHGYIALGALLVKLGEWDAAEAVYRAGLNESIWHFELYVHLGNLLLQTDRPEEAIRIYQKALQLSPNHTEVLHALSLIQTQSLSDQCFYKGKYWASQHQHTEAILAYQRSLAHDSTHFASALGLCESYQELQQVEPVRSLVAATLPPLADHVPLDSHHLRSLLLCLNKQNDSNLSRHLVRNHQFFKVSALQNLLEQINFPILYATSEEIPQFRQNFEAAIDEILQLDFQDPLIQDELFSFFRSFIHAFLNYQGENDRAIQVKCATIVETLLTHRYPHLQKSHLQKSHWQKSHLQKPLYVEPFPSTSKIRIGYASYYLRRHNGARWALGWIQNHDREKFEIFTYHFGEILDGYSKAFATAATEFKHLPEADFLTFEEWFETAVHTLQNDRLQILIFPDLGMEPRTYLLSKLRLAPIQCTAWGHPVTSGSSHIDYYLSSHLMESEQAQNHYQETLIRLPHLGLCYATPSQPKEQKTRSFFQLPADRILYLSCQSLFKYLPQYDDLYPAIAQQVPTAYFVFIETFLLSKAFEQRLAHHFSQVGLDHRQYCQILPKQSWEHYMQLQRVADIYLDTIAWTGGNSTLEAIASGLPVVTYPGEQMRSRHSAAILQRLGVTETIAHSLPEYLEIAVELGKNPQWRSHLQAQYKKKSHRLFDDRQVAQSLDQVLLSLISSPVPSGAT